MKPVFASLLGAAAGGPVDSSNNAKSGAAFVLASVVAGAVAAILLCPMESTRIKIVTDPNYAQDNMLTALAKLAATEGLASSFSGLWAMLAKQVPYTFGKQVSFDVFAGLLYTLFEALQKSKEAATAANVPTNDAPGMKWAVSVLAAAAASLIACIFSQPGDMILTETYRPKKQFPAATKPPLVVSTTSTTRTTTPAPAVRDPVAAWQRFAKGILPTPSAAAASVSGAVAMPSSPLVANPSRATKASKTTTSTAQEVKELAASTSSTTTHDDDGDEGAAAHKPSTAFVHVVARLYAEGGIAKFFTGTQARIVHVGLIITSQLVIYDLVKQLLGLPATGSH